MMNYYIYKVKRIVDFHLEKYGSSFLCVVTQRSPHKTDKAVNKREGTVRLLRPRGGWGCEFFGCFV